MGKAVFANDIARKARWATETVGEGIFHLHPFTFHLYPFTFHLYARRVRHLQHVGHVAGGTRVENGVGDALRVWWLYFENARFKRARIERYRLARLQIDGQVRMAPSKIKQQRHKAFHVVVGARDVVSTPEVDPLHLRQQVAELLLEAGKDLLQLVQSLLAKAMEVEAGNSWQLVVGSW